jgi:hypothetical protein
MRKEPILMRLAVMEHSATPLTNAGEFGEDDGFAGDFVAVADADVVEVNMRRTGIGGSAEVGVRSTIAICGLHQANVKRPRGSGSLIQPLQIVIRPRPPAPPLLRAETSW